MTPLLAAASPHISLVAEPLIEAGPLRITNSGLYGLIGTVILIGLLVRSARRIKARKYDRLSLAVLWVYEALATTAEEVMGDRAKARRIAPLAITMFLVIMANNWLGLVPLVGPLTTEGVPLFRGLAADLNFTLALALITMVTAQVWAFREHGFAGNLGRYFVNPLKSPMGTVVGFLELIAEFSRLIALSMRLFGNIFGGEVLLVVIGFITAWAAPVSLPLFMALELFVGAIQAYVFFMLTLVFVSLGAAHHGDDQEAVAAEHPVAKAT